MPPPKKSAPGPTEGESALTAAPVGESGVAALTDHLFRHEAGRLISILTGIFGIHRLQLAEDVVQEALVRALRTWPSAGVPEQPAAWLMKTARNLALDRIRRETRFAEKQPEIITHLEQRMPDTEDGGAAFEDGIKDDRLRLMFACCHPALPAEAQMALALKVLCGFSPLEIAHAFLISEAAVAKRLVRARQKLREEDVAFEIPEGPELPARLDTVLRILYLLFNEGYKASAGEVLVRGELCGEAVRLGTLLAGHPAGNQPSTHALLALMCLNSARLPARTDQAGNLLRLGEQDRTRWDQALIRRGVLHMGSSAQGETAGEYHLEAAISACHCLAPSGAATDWQRILDLYDRLAALNGSPVIALNRAVAVARVHGPARGLEAIAAIPDPRALESYHLFHAVRGELEAERGRNAEAVRHWREALRLTEVPSERALLRRRILECGVPAEE